MYRNYKNARDKAWQTLIECKVNKLPVNLAIVANFYDIAIIKYSQVNDMLLTGDGFSTRIGNRFILYYNDIDYPVPRQRFTIAHEIGHCLLGHFSEGEQTFRHSRGMDDYKDTKEIQANIFARDILMPATVLHSLNVKSADDISKICNVSKKSAEIRFNRLRVLNRRGMYNMHPLEQQVYKQFLNYIERVLDTGNI